MEVMATKLFLQDTIEILTRELRIALENNDALETENRLLEFAYQTASRGEPVASCAEFTMGGVSTPAPEAEDEEEEEDYYIFPFAIMCSAMVVARILEETAEELPTTTGAELLGFEKIRDAAASIRSILENTMPEDRWVAEGDVDQMYNIIYGL